MTTYALEEDLELVWKTLSNNGTAEAARFYPDQLAAQLGLTLDRFGNALRVLEGDHRIAFQPLDSGVLALIQNDPSTPWVSMGYEVAEELYEQPRPEVLVPEVVAQRIRSRRPRVYWSTPRNQEIADRRANGESVAALAAAFGLSRTRIEQIVERQRQRDVLEPSAARLNLEALVRDLEPRVGRDRPFPPRHQPSGCSVHDSGSPPCGEPAVYSFARPWRNGKLGRACEHHWKSSVEPRLIADGVYEPYDPRLPKQVSPVRRQWLIKSWFQRERSPWVVARDRREQCWWPAYARAKRSDAGMCAACERPLGELTFVYTTHAGIEISYCARADCGCL